MQVSCCTFQERKISPKRKFWGRTSRGHPGVIHADIPAQNFGQGGQNPGKKKQAFWRGHPWPEGADVHDPKGFPKKLRSEKLRAEFSFTNVCQRRRNDDKNNFWEVESKRGSAEGSKRGLTGDPSWNFMVGLKHRKNCILESRIFIVVAFSQEIQWQ